MNLEDICYVNQDNERFVGIIAENDIIKINFPLGYRLSNKEELLREDIISLMKVLKLFNNNENDNLKKSNERQRLEETFPFFEYKMMLSYYLDYGLYFERKVNFKQSKNGKIKWNKTIKKEKPYFINNKILPHIVVDLNHKSILFSHLYI